MVTIDWRWWTGGGDGPVGEVGWTDVGGGLMVVDGCVADWWWWELVVMDWC